MKDCNHEIAWKPGFHIDNNHPTLDDQFCMNCKKTLRELMADTRKQTIEEVRKALWNGATRDEVHARLDKLEEVKKQ